MSFRRTQILVKGLAANTKITGDLCFCIAGRNTRLGQSNVIIRERPLSTSVGTALLGQRNAFALPLTDERAFEFCERSHHGQHEFGHWRILASERQSFFDKLNTYTLVSERLNDAAQIIEVACESIHTVHDYRVTVPNKLRHCVKLFAVNVFAGLFVEERSVNGNVLELTLRILIERAHANVSDPLSSLFCHSCSPQVSG